jgi:uncharacterized membrane protein
MTDVEKAIVESPVRVSMPSAEAQVQPETATEVDEPPDRSFRAKMRWVLRRRLCFGGLAGALVFFCLSLTPSLLPRGALLQGTISGITVVIGYGLGSAFSAGIRKVISTEPGRHFKRIAWWALLCATVVLVPLFLVLARSWQDEVRDLMGMESLAAWEWGAILVVSAVVAVLLLLVSRVVRGFARVLARFIDRFAPRAVSVTVSVVLTIVLVVGLIQGFILDPAVSALNSAYSLKNDGTDAGIRRQLNPERSGSPTSKVPWDTLGVKGRNFIGSGPTAEQISEFTGKPAKDPIRVYVGLDSADTLKDRVNLAIAELDRTHAWNRKVIAVFTTTGTGWVDANAADPLEYMHNGDTALVAMQYSFLPSWISFLVDLNKAADAGREMIHAVQARLAEMPKATRPKLLVFGESLGSYGSEEAFNDVNDMISGVDGALFEGPVFHNHIHSTVTNERDSGSPYWRPVYKNGEHVRFAAQISDLKSRAADWKAPHILYLQNATDPITYWNPDLLWKSPDWLDDPRGPDVSPSMFWMPVVTFWQTTADMAFSTGVPDGHGHSYGPNAVDGWAAVYAPKGWTNADTQRLRAIMLRDWIRRSGRTTLQHE